MKKKLDIDGPAGRQEVNQNYLDNYDAIFRKEVRISFCGRTEVCAQCADCTPECHLNGQTLPIEKEVL